MRIFLLLILLLVATKSNSQNTNLAIADPVNYLHDLKDDMQKEWPKNRIINLVFHGHSVPAGYFKTPQINTISAYPHLLLTQLKALYPYAQLNIIVTAIGGENSINGAKRFKRDVLSHKPDILFIDYALNDRGIGVNKAYDAWNKMIKMAKVHGIKVILLTPSPDQNVDYSDTNNELKIHSNQIRKLASEHHIGLADSYKAFEPHYSNKEKLSEMMSQVNHPNEKGHELITNELIKWFQ